MCFCSSRVLLGQRREVRARVGGALENKTSLWPLRREAELPVGVGRGGPHVSLQSQEGMESLSEPPPLNPQPGSKIPDLFRALLSGHFRVEAGPDGGR